MSYSVEHLRAKLECDACGEKKVIEAENEKALLLPPGWVGFTRAAIADLSFRQSYLCCPECTENLNTILLKKARADVAAERERIASCEHVFVQRGFIQLCAKCGTSPPLR